MHNKVSQVALPWNLSALMLHANLRLHKLALSWSISLEADCGKTNQTATSMLKIA